MVAVPDLGARTLLCGRRARAVGAGGAGTFGSVVGAVGAGGASGAEAVWDGAGAGGAALGVAVGSNGGAAMRAGGSGKGAAARGSRHLMTAKVIRKVSAAIARTRSRLRAAASRGSLRSSSVTSMASAMGPERKCPPVVQRPRRRAKRLGRGRRPGLSRMAAVVASVIGAATGARSDGVMAPRTGGDGLGGRGDAAGAISGGSFGR